MVAMIREADREPVSVVGKWARSRRSTHGASVSGAFRRTCGADEGAVGAVSALRLSSHPHLSRADGYRMSPGRPYRLLRGPRLRFLGQSTPPHSARKQDLPL